MRFNWLVALMLLGAVSAHGDDLDPIKEKQRKEGGGGLTDLFKDGELLAPTEQAFKLPELTALKNWYPYRVSGDNRGDADYYVALDSVSVGAEDHIIRYAMAVVPRSGNVRNTRYEGIDCNTSQFRTYAWGDDKNEKWQESQRAWKVIVNKQRHAYQADLAEELCDGSSPKKMPDILNELSGGRKRGAPCPSCAPYDGGTR